MLHRIVNTYEEASQAVEQLGILPLSNFIPGHPSLESLTEPGAWHTGADTDPWHWRVRFAAEGSAAYGRFLGLRPLLIARGVFPLVACLLASPQSVQERYAAGLLARATVRIYEIIQQSPGIEVRVLRRRAGMQDKADKPAFDHALIALQNSADIVMSGVAENRTAQGHNSGWSGTCYMLAEGWMEGHGITPLQLSPTDAKTQLFAWLTPRWDEQALGYLHKKLAPFSS